MKFLHTRGYSTMMVWVLADNESTYFYEAMGGVKVKSDFVNIGNQELSAYGYEFDL